MPTNDGSTRQGRAGRIDHTTSFNKTNQTHPAVAGRHGCDGLPKGEVRRTFFGSLLVLCVCFWLSLVAVEDVRVRCSPRNAETNTNSFVLVPSIGQGCPNLARRSADQLFLQQKTKLRRPEADKTNWAESQTFVDNGRTPSETTERGGTVTSLISNTRSPIFSGRREPVPAEGGV